MSESFAETRGFPTLVEAARLLPPEIAIVLGSGMNDVARELRVELSASFLQVPGLAATSVSGHRGQLSLGDWTGKRVLVFEGRLHHYEGHSWRDVVTSVRTAHFLGAPLLLLTNAAGGIHEALEPGCLMAIRDHIDWTRSRPWKQAGPGGMGPDRPSPYSPRLLQMLTQAAHGLGMELHQGIYAALMGPNYETPAEIRALRAWGADAVGMSTAREIETGHGLGMECVGLSCITNRAAGLAPGIINHKEVLTTAADQLPRLAELLGRFLQLL